MHSENSFATFTYSDEEIPKNGTLQPKDMQKFFKRLRKLYEPQKVRFFMCGEYGERTHRPHYHAILFGIGPQQEELVRRVWGKGIVHLGDVTVESAQYVAGYVMKKMNHTEDKCSSKCKHPPLNGRVPEFSRMSRNPGIGAKYVPLLVSTLNNHMDIVEVSGDVPTALQHGPRMLPLGRYLRKKIRKGLGYAEEKTPPEVLRRMQEEDEIYKAKNKEEVKKIIGQRKQKLLNFETRQKIFSRKDKL